MDIVQNEFEVVKHEPEPQSEVGSIMAVIERCVLNPDVDIEKMQKLLDMQERILNRNAKQAFASSLARMQSEIPEITKKGEIKINGKVQSTYGLFEDINEQVRPILKAHGFAISFRIKQSDKLIKVTAILSHEQGHTEETELDLPIDTSGNKNAVQAVGSSVQYGKRYTMCALLNITTRGEDDDAQSTTDQACITKDQQKVIASLVAKLSNANVSKFVDEYPKVPEIKKSEFDLVVARINKSLRYPNA